MNEVSVIKEGWLHKRGKGLLLPAGLCISPVYVRMYMHARKCTIPRPPTAAVLRGRDAGSSQPQGPASEPRLPHPGHSYLQASFIEPVSSNLGEGAVAPPVAKSPGLPGHPA